MTASCQSRLTFLYGTLYNESSCSLPELTELHNTTRGTIPAESYGDNLFG